MPERERQLVLGLIRRAAAARSRESGVARLREMISQLTIDFPVQDSVVVNRVDAGGVSGLMISHGSSTVARTLMWCHAGGYVAGSANAYRSYGSDLAKASDAEVLMLDYRLAPEHRFPASIEDVIAAYRWLVANRRSSHSIAIGGDSAGGGLALGAVLALKDAGDPAPGACVVTSPVADQTFSGPSLHLRRERDPITTPESLAMFGGMYRQDTEASHPYLSPVFGDWEDAPPLLALVGTEEILFDDALRVVERAQRVGVDATLLIGQREFHCWPCYPHLLPEAEEAINEIGRFVKQHTGVKDFHG